MEPVVAGSKYLIDFQGIAAYAKKRKSRRIAIQLPEGLRMFEHRSLSALRSTLVPMFQWTQIPALVRAIFPRTYFLRLILWFR